MVPADSVDLEGPVVDSVDVEAPVDRAARVEADPRRKAPVGIRLQPSIDSCSSTRTKTAN